MIYIAHRGNIDGPNKDKENNPDYILNAINHNFDVEIDVWYIDNKFVLGHDCPQYEVDTEFLLNKHFWHHAKNVNAMFHLNRMKPNYLINCFYHNIDDVALTSGGWLWTYPGKEINCDSIAVLPELVLNWNISSAYGICSDYPYKYKQLFG